jgi:hypothetical protein
MAELSYGEVVNLKSVMFNDRSRYLSKWKDAASYFSPNRFAFNTADKHDGSRKDQKIYRDTARLALRTFVAGMSTGATPQSKPWFKLVSADPLASNDNDAKKFFSTVERIISSHFQLSNLYRILPSAYKDVGAFSNAAYAMLPHPQYGFYFYPFAVGSYGFSSNPEGRTDTFFREFTMTVKQVVQKYGILKPTGQIDWENSLNDYIRGAWEAKRYQDIVILTNVIVPNHNPMKNPLYSKDKLFQSYTYIDSAGGNIQNQMPSGFAQMGAGMGRGGGTGTGIFLSVRGYDYFPVITPRWEVSPEEDYGTDGPGELAIAATKGLQSKEQYKQEAIVKMVKPPMIGPAALRRHQSSILAGGITYVDEAHKGQFRPAMTVDPKISELVGSQNDDIADIKSAFFEDLFLMLAGAPPTSHVTKVEVQERAAERMQALAPILGQLDQDQNGRLIENAYIILNSIGRIPPPPKSLQGGKIKPEYISALAQAAKASEMTSIETAVGFVGNYANTVQDPALLQMFRHEEIIKRYVVDYVGVDPDLLKSDEEYAAVKEQVAQAQAQAQAMQLANNEAALAKDLSQAKLGENSALDTLIE